MNIEGNLEISIERNGVNPPAVDIRSSRPFQAVKLFHGKSPEQLLDLIPLLFSICGTAQAYAACRASHIALSRSASPGIAQAQQLLVDLETTREHLWRILLDWPQWLDWNTEQQKPLQKAAAELAQLLPRAKQALFVSDKPFALDSQLREESNSYTHTIEQQLQTIEEIIATQILGQPAEEWLEANQQNSIRDWLAHNTPKPSSSNNPAHIAALMLEKVLHQGWEKTGANTITTIPELAPQTLHEHFLQADVEQFIAQPHWDEQVYETTPLQRQAQHPLLMRLKHEYGNGLLTRLVARLVELAKMPQKLRIQLAHIKTAQETDQSNEMALEWYAEGFGLAQVEAARGRLIHWIHIEDNKVKDFRILAPTEWNFHPQGVAAQGLQNIHTQDSATYKQQADLWLNSIDPCVSYQLEIK